MKSAIGAGAASDIAKSALGEPEEFLDQKSAF